MESILVHYGELALKGAKREYFEQTLIDNIAHSLKIDKEQIKQYKGQLVVVIDQAQVKGTVDILQRVMGITWVMPVVQCENDMHIIRQKAVEVVRPILTKGKKFAVRGHRSIRSLPFDSQDIQREVGEVILEATHAQVDLDQPDVDVNVTASQEGTYIYTRKFPGPGGLPVGTSGNALALLSGGFDSIAAAYLLAKRGALVDFIHFHVFPDQKPVLDSKILQISRQLCHSTMTKYLYLSSYLPFEFRVLDLNGRLRRVETVVFRRLMVKVAEEIANRNGYQALVLGDCLGQVASQTMENISSVDLAVRLPIFRPLIGFDKVEIIRLVKEIGLYDLAVAEYKDCCSLLSPEPSIKADLAAIERLEMKIGLEKVVDEMVGAVEKVSLG
jgi:thiamine biosynthesis protein ThiI